MGELGGFGVLTQHVVRVCACSTIRGSFMILCNELLHRDHLYGMDLVT